jgi:uncharacterized protein with PIN domain
VIVADTSAIVAILCAEPEANLLAGVIGEFRSLLSVVLFEASMVMIGRGQSALAQGLDTLIGELAIEIVPFDEEQARQSREAFVRFGPQSRRLRFLSAGPVARAAAPVQGNGFRKDGRDQRVGLNRSEKGKARWATRQRSAQPATSFPI